MKITGDFSESWICAILGKLSDIKKIILENFFKEFLLSKIMSITSLCKISHLEVTKKLFKSWIFEPGYCVDTQLYEKFDFLKNCRKFPVEQDCINGKML